MTTDADRTSSSSVCYYSDVHMLLVANFLTSLFISFFLFDWILVYICVSQSDEP